MKFREVKDGIRKGLNLEYFTKWYNYEVDIDVHVDVVYYILTQGVNKAFCRINKDEFMEMSYKDLVKTLNETLYYSNIY